MMVDIKKKEGGQSNKTPAIKVTGMPGKHVPSGIVGTLNDMVKAVRCPNYVLFGSYEISLPYY